MPTPLLRITDGTFHVDLVSTSKSGLKLKEWIPKYAPLKSDGSWQSSSLADGRRLSLYKYENIIDTFELVAVGQSQDAVIKDTQEINRLLTQARDYHTSPFILEPVWIEAKGSCETNTRYSLIYNYKFDRDGDPYSQPFFGMWPYVGMNDLTLIIEHGPWLETVPGVETCVDISAGHYVGSTYYGRESANFCNDIEGYSGLLLQENNDRIYLEGFGGFLLLESGASSTSACVANKQTTRNLTQVYHCDVSTGVWTNITAAAVPYAILPAAPAVGDYIIFGIDNPDPFCSLVFDISTVSIGGAITWQYSIAGPAWSNFASANVTDNTASFTFPGSNSVHWKQPNNWAPIPSGPGGISTCYWIRALVSAAGTTPQQDERSIYTVAWPNFHVDFDQVPGDLPANGHIAIFPKSADSDTALGFDTLTVGLRSTGRGDSFWAYLNCADEQLPGGIFCQLTNGVIVTRTEAPSGRAGLMSIPGSGTAYIDYIMNSSIYPSYRGTYHAFCRVRQRTDVTNTVRFHVELGPYVSTTFYSLWNSSPSLPVVTVTTNPYFELVDLGRVTLPPSTFIESYQVLDIRVVAEKLDVNPATLDFWDFILIPVDEWAGTFTEPVAGMQVDYDNRLDVDSIKDPKKFLRAINNLRAAVTTFTPYETVANGPVILQANTGQRYWFLASLDGEANPAICSGVVMYRQSKYQSMRGAR